MPINNDILNQVNIDNDVIDDLLNMHGFDDDILLELRNRENRNDVNDKPDALTQEHEHVQRILESSERFVISPVDKQTVTQRISDTAAHLTDETNEQKLARLHRERDKLEVQLQKLKEKERENVKENYSLENPLGIDL